MAKQQIASLLVRASVIETMFGEVGADKNVPLGVHETATGKRFKIGDTPESAKAALQNALAYLMDEQPKTTALGLGSYGPLRSVALSDRASETKAAAVISKVDPRPRYGCLWKHTRHVALRDLGVYETALEVLGPKTKIDLRAHTDVSCGAIAESLDRQFAKINRKLIDDERRIAVDDPVFFAHVWEGVGASWAVDGRPWTGMMHSEVGYSHSQLLRDDLWGWWRFDEAGADRGVSLEHLVETAAKERRMAAAEASEDAKVRERRVAEQWKFLGEYVAQMCQLAAVVVSPARIVLDGPMFDENKDMLKDVRAAFVGWLRSYDEGQRAVHFDKLEDRFFIDRPVTKTPALRGALLLTALPEVALSRWGWTRAALRGDTA